MPAHCSTDESVGCADSAAVTALQWWRTNDPTAPAKTQRPPASTAAAPLPTAQGASVKLAVDETVPGLQSVGEQRAVSTATRLSAALNGKRKRKEGGSSAAAAVCDDQSGQGSQAGVSRAVVEPSEVPLPGTTAVEISGRCGQDAPAFSGDRSIKEVCEGSHAQNWLSVLRLYKVAHWGKANSTSPGCAIPWPQLSSCKSY